MKFALASYGSRGDVEPCVALSRELLSRGHDVCMAVAPDMIAFVESAGVKAVAYGLPTRPWQDVHRELSTRFSRHLFKDRDLISLIREDWQLFKQSWGQMSSALISMAKDADLLLTGILAEDAAANVAEYYDIPLATLHFAPLRANGQALPFLPAAVGRSTGQASDWVGWRLTKRLDDTQRRELGLPKATNPAPRRIVERGSLEIQAYDEMFFPGLATEWANLNVRRPFVGALTMELPADDDDEVIDWINAGTPPIYFGFGSIPVDSPGETLAMISAACAELGERALIVCGWTDFTDVAHANHVKVVTSVNHAAVFPTCRAVVHHGGAGTTAAGLRAGVPTLILSTWVEQALWGASVKRLKAGTTRRIPRTTAQSLVADLRTILAPQCLARAREVAAEMTSSAESVSTAADLVEDHAGGRRTG